jgi:mycothiol synthase
MSVASPVAGLAIRPYAGPGDLPNLVRVYNADAAADGVEEFWTEEGAGAEFGHPTEHFDAGRDVVIAELDGRIVAAAGMDWIDTRDGAHREYRHWGVVDPPFRGRGIGSALLDVQADHARELARGADLGARTPTLGSFAGAGRPSEALLGDHEYSLVRWFFDMVRPNLDDIAMPPLPDSLEIRPVTGDQLEAIWWANREAFRDHWGGSDESLEHFQRILDEPDTDPSLWVIAWDGDEIAGGIWNQIHAAENEELGLRRGWLASVFTRRPWRRRGLAAALIGRSLELLKSRGMTEAALGVDADNPSGALGLYEAAGFAVHDRFTAWRKPLELDDR